MTRYKNAACFFWAVVVSLLLISGCGPSDQSILNKYTGGESKFVDINGLKVHYRDVGTGPVLLGIHGVQSSLHTWDGWAKALKSKYRIIRIDLPGWGFTGPSNFGYQPDKTTAFLKKFIDTLGVKKIYLAGNSYGGFVSWNFAKDYPDVVEKLILIDAGGYPMKSPLIVTLLSTPVIRDVSAMATPKFAVAHFVRDVYGDKSRVTQETIDRYYSLMMYDGNRKESVKFMREARQHMEKEPVGVNTIKVPTLIMWGREDTWIPLDVMERFKKDMPHARAIVYDGVGHIPMEEIPEITAKDADNFLSGQ